ncbi:MAG: hypothetical protein XU14_C0009G0039 [Armatimonadetes bacterium CSP1-3]|nr:MAG: hypothetical protein XU14_C0009G0039 [Armatimonadetes bacterium CSP1-3]
MSRTTRITGVARGALLGWLIAWVRAVAVAVR